MGKLAMADAIKTTTHHIGHMTYTQAPVVHEKNIFHLFRFTQPVKNYSYYCLCLNFFLSTHNVNLPGMSLQTCPCRSSQCLFYTYTTANKQEII